MEETTTTRSLALVNKEISKELEDPHIVKALLATTFKDFDETLMRQAVFEGVIRGFAFKNFLEKDVYAIKYHDHKKNLDTYSLVTSIDHARKLGMHNGVIGKSAPQYTFMDDSTSEVETCSVTIKRRVGQDIGEFTATVYFSEYSTSKNLWATKPRTMIAKVAEMHALRMACPEEMAKLYTEEEFDKDREPEGTSYKVVRRPQENEHEERPNLLLYQNSRDKEPDATIPESDTERKVLILKELKRIDPSFDASDAKAAGKMVYDLSKLPFEPESYANIIYILARK